MKRTHTMPEIQKALQEAFQTQQPLDYNDGKTRDQVVITDDPAPLLAQGLSIEASPVGNPAVLYYINNPAERLSLFA